MALAQASQSVRHRTCHSLFTDRSTGSADDGIGPGRARVTKANTFLPSEQADDFKDFHPATAGTIQLATPKPFYNQLVQRFSKDRVFMDVDAIEPGVDFVP